MARWPPPLPAGGARPPSFGHDAVLLSLFVASVVATVSLVSFMCSACGRRPKAARRAAAAADVKSSATDSSSSSGSGGGSSESVSSGGGEAAVVTLSPELATHGPIEPVGAALPASTSKRRLSISLSKNLSVNKMRLSLSMNLPDKMRLSRRERREKVEPEDTLWKKAIILGEKCKIPGEREGETEADAADELAAGSFRRSSYSRPMSRSTSFAVHQHDVPPAPSPTSHNS